MAIRVAVYAIGASLAMLGCAHEMRTILSQTCSSSPCAVAIGEAGFWPFHHLVVPDEINVSSTPMKITWTLDSSVPGSVYFPGKPIVFEPGAQRYFECSFESSADSHPRSYTCVDTAPKGTYKYSIKTLGLGAPPDIDPTVVNN